MAYDVNIFETRDGMVLRVTRDGSTVVQVDTPAHVRDRHNPSCEEWLVSFETDLLDRIETGIAEGSITEVTE